MKRCARLCAPLLLGAVLAGCASAPMGPTVAVMPPPGMPFDQFQFIDSQCRAYAQQQTTGYTDRAQKSAATTAVTGALLGAAAGALIGDHSGSAGVGAGVGLAAGGIGGTGAYNSGQEQAQRAYDTAYQQCMYSKGAQVPGYRAPAYTPPPAPYYAPPPSPMR